MIGATTGAASGAATGAPTGAATGAATDAVTRRALRLDTDGAATGAEALTDCCVVLRLAVRPRCDLALAPTGAATGAAMRLGAT